MHKTSSTKCFHVTSIGSLKAGVYHNGYCVVLESGIHKAHIFDADGNETGSLRALNISDFKDGKRAVALLESKRWAIVDTKGTIIKELDSKLDEYTHPVFKNGYYICKYANIYTPDVCYNSNGEIVDMELTKTVSDKWVESGRFVAIHDFSEGLAAAAVLDGSAKFWGFVNEQGTFVIPPKFSNEPRDFHEGYAGVQKKDGSWCFINTEGKVCSEDYGYVDRFFEGYALIKKKGESSTFDKSYVLSKDFEIVAQTAWSMAGLDFNYSNGTIQRGDGKIFSPKGEVILDHDSTLESIDEGPALTSINENGNRHPVYVNLNGEIVLCFEENEF